MAKKKNLPLIENVTITGVAAEGKALVRINDIVTFVPNCVPGDVVDLQITKKKHTKQKTCRALASFLLYQDDFRTKSGKGLQK